MFLLIVWAGATINFLMPRMAPVNPIRERLLQAVSFGGAGKTDMEAVVATYEARFGPTNLCGSSICAIPPIAMIVLIFLGLFLVSMGLDRIANPRIWKVSS